MPDSAPIDAERHARGLAFWGALLFGLGGLTGLYVGAAQTGKIDVAASAALASHLNALLGAFWLFGLGWSLRFVVLSPAQLDWLIRLTVVAAYANWAVTAVKAALRVHGVDWIGEGANDAIFVTLTATVVLPTLAASALWVWGLKRRGA